MKYEFTFSITAGGKSAERIEQFPGNGLRQARQALFTKYGSRNTKILKEERVVE